MRLSEAEVAIIRQAVAESFGSSARVRLFGSHTDDAGRGGDVDLYVEPGGRDDLYRRRIRCLARLAARLPYPVDLVVADEEGLRPIDRVAVLLSLEKAGCCPAHRDIVRIEVSGYYYPVICIAAYALLMQHWIKDG